MRPLRETTSRVERPVISGYQVPWASYPNFKALLKGGRGTFRKSLCDAFLGLLEIHLSENESNKRRVKTRILQMLISRIFCYYV